jgi:hypothetical protein
MRAADLEARLRDGTVPGLAPEAEVQLLPAGSLAAAVSRVPSDRFSEVGLNALVQDFAALAPLALAHEEVVRFLAAGPAPVVPLSFGTVYRDAGAVAHLLETRSGRFSELLDRLQGTVEWTLKVVVDARQLAAAAIGQSVRLRDLEEQAAVATPGRSYLLHRQIERAAPAEADRLAREAVNGIIDQLGGLSIDTRLDDVMAAAGEVQMVARAAFLIESAREPAFASAVEALQDRYGELGLRLEMTGPWAPYSFVALDGIG